MDTSKSREYISMVRTTDLRRTLIFPQECTQNCRETRPKYLLKFGEDGDRYQYSQSQDRTSIE